MDLIKSIILPMHVLAGFVSLILFWLPVFVKKGGKLHTKIGWAYVYAMWFVVVSAGLLSIINLVAGHYFNALFLGYLTVITGMPLWYGISILKYKKGATVELYNRKRLLYLFIVIFGLVNVIYAIVLQFTNGTILLFIFGLLGVADIRHLRVSFEKYKSQVDPIKDHISGMLVTGIAAYTAFFAFGGRTWLGEVFTGQLMIIPWVAPTVLGVIGIKWYQAKFVKKAAVRS